MASTPHKSSPTYVFGAGTPEPEYLKAAKRLGFDRGVREYFGDSSCRTVVLYPGGKAVREDWRVVGSDLRTAIEKVAITYGSAEKTTKQAKGGRIVRRKTYRRKGHEVRSSAIEVL